MLIEEAASGGAPKLTDWDSYANAYASFAALILLARSCQAAWSHRKRVKGRIESAERQLTTLESRVQRGRSAQPNPARSPKGAGTTRRRRIDELHSLKGRCAAECESCEVNIETAAGVMLSWVILLAFWMLSATDESSKTDAVLLGEASTVALLFATVSVVTRGRLFTMDRFERMIIGGILCVAWPVGLTIACRDVMPHAIAVIAGSLSAVAWTALGAALAVKWESVPTLVVLGAYGLMQPTLYSIVLESYVGGEVDSTMRPYVPAVLIVSAALKLLIGAWLAVHLARPDQKRHIQPDRIGLISRAFSQFGVAVAPLSITYKWIVAPDHYESAWRGTAVLSAVLLVLPFMYFSPFAQKRVVPLIKKVLEDFRESGDDEKDDPELDSDSARDPAPDEDLAEDDEELPLETLTPSGSAPKSPPEPDQVPDREGVEG
ncbi:MAG: hypothetical protein AAFU73_00215 [Planctomycetota bacterium]